MWNGYDSPSTRNLFRLAIERGPQDRASPSLKTITMQLSYLSSTVCLLQVFHSFEASLKLIFVVNGSRIAHPMQRSINTSVARSRHELTNSSPPSRKRQAFPKKRFRG